MLFQRLGAPRRATAGSKCRKRYQQTHDTVLFEPFGRYCQVNAYLMALSLALPLPC